MQAVVDAELKRIASHLERREFPQALTAAQTLHENAPTHRDALFLLAVSHRTLRQLPEALATLRELEKHHPHFGRLFQERGHCHVALRAPLPAIDAYTRAVSLNFALLESWEALEDLYRQAGRSGEAQTAARHRASLMSMPVALRTAFDMYGNGDVARAEELVRHFLATQGEHVDALRLLAMIAMNSNLAHDAELLLERALTLTPNHTAARYEYALALMNRQRHERARAQLDLLLAASPDDINVRALYAAACAGMNDYDAAIPLYRELESELPEHAELQLTFAHSLKALGRIPEAIDGYRRAACLRPHFGEAYWSLANLKTYPFSDAELCQMRAAESDPAAAPVDRYHLCFALGKAFEDRKHYADAFAYYQRGNEMKEREVRFNADAVATTLRLTASLCTAEFFAARNGHGSEAADPIFIVGLPRSGSTLVEQILASHSQIDGTMELAEIPRLAQDLHGSSLTGGGPGYPRRLADLSALVCRRLGEQYLRDTRVYRTGKRLFIDKMPNNFQHIGLIHLILPNAKIIDVRRDPMACCFSIYKQLFAAGQRFAYSFDSIARYRQLYVDLMAHWDRVLPGKVLRIRHEDLVADLEKNVRRMLEFCEVEYEPTCLEFHRTRRAVHSASSEQVHQPLSTEGVDHWRHFEPWLDPLRAALRRAGAS